MGESVDWKYYELDKELGQLGVFELLLFFKETNRHHQEKCTDFAKAMCEMGGEGKKELEKEINYLRDAKIRISLRIAEELTK